ncbi:hypothetical protein NOVOSPHI9U_780053 [Novosphingobium sp. 9U]|nr:hypothetical protein NOVOSPHI9U_780053 [Novosphingobium sp. 9U]
MTDSSALHICRFTGRDDATEWLHCLVANMTDN